MDAWRNDDPLRRAGASLGDDDLVGRAGEHRPGESADRGAGRDRPHRGDDLANLLRLKPQGWPGSGLGLRDRRPQAGRRHL